MTDLDEASLLHELPQLAADLVIAAEVTKIARQKTSPFFRATRRSILVPRRAERNFNGKQYVAKIINFCLFKILALSLCQRSEAA
jgi:hypothetical protein